MFQITFSDIASQATAALNGRFDQLRKQHKVLVTAALPAFVSMARVQAGESVLDVNCGDGELLAEIAVTWLFYDLPVLKANIVGSASDEYYMRLIRVSFLV